MTSWEVRIPNSAAFWGLVCRLQPKRLVFIEVLRVDKALAILEGSRPLPHLERP
ncbi:MAG: hypothetical protein IPK80_28220 [Nannocystis sp.]|nr:hypothetical protein [Nannocystis sp.]